ncbi:MAG: serpin family protein [Lachnospiraceae bacterium]|nr:serpin family protein [Lachnospiraceae bacterium]
MKVEDFFETLEGIDENSIEEARKYVGKRKQMRRVRWISLAACAALFLLSVLTVPLVHGIRNQSAAQSPSGSVATEMYDNKAIDADEEVYDTGGAEVADEMYDAGAVDEEVAANADTAVVEVEEENIGEAAHGKAANAEGSKSETNRKETGEEAEIMENAAALPEDVLKGIKQTAAKYPPAVAETMSAQEFAESEEHWKWWEDYSKQVDASAAYQSDMRGYYQEIMEKLLASGNGNSDAENTVCSPLNTFVAFAMLAEVTDGNTRQQILDMLKVSDMKHLRKEVAAIWESNYVNTPALKSLLANSLWLASKAEYNEDTLRSVADLFHSSSYRGRMGSDEMNRALQMWTDSNTGGLLGEYTKDMKLDADTILAIVSTIYYKAAWMDAFQEADTKQEVFHGTGGDATVAMMHRSSMMEVCRTDTFASVGLGLSDSGAMYFYLPKEGVDVDDLVGDPNLLRATIPDEYDAVDTTAIPDEDAAVDNTTVPGADGAVNKKTIPDKGDAVDTESGSGRNLRKSYLLVNLSVPKFKVSGKTDLIKAIKELGVTDVLAPNASDFSPLASGAAEIYLGSADHAAMVEVDEEGVTGAAYTELALSLGAAMPDEVIDFVLDRPFLFVITGRDGSVLFSGIVRNI